MDARTFDKSKLPSRHVADGPSRVPYRSHSYAPGFAETEISQPFAGIVSRGQAAAPCDIALKRQWQPAKAMRRINTWKASPNSYQSGAIKKFAVQVGQAPDGAETHAGGKAEIVCYADI
ncbi:MAG: hypothetical protein JNN24_15180 [Hyphomicrobium zavarzinii]|uniref:hypothetical protein n=1 Tax=Hyphomicrobium zavarzinii TaxID=48292 RepID=UPI001A493944|nr:hypothetical protein [Hyphomicrobium zavarzinii]MBL8847106.1 hypothetical protein [Hyphomicrobium zavarzinii]